MNPAASSGSVTDRGILIVFLTFVLVMTWRLPNPREFLIVVGLAFLAFILLEQQYATALFGNITTDITTLHTNFSTPRGGTNATTATATKR